MKYMFRIEYVKQLKGRGRKTTPFKRVNIESSSVLRG